MAPTPCVVIDATGHVLHTEGGVPSTWMGRELASIPDAPPSVRHTAVTLIEGSDAFFQRTFSDEGTEVVRMSAIPIRRAYTRVTELLGRTMDAFLQQARAADIELHVERSEDVPATAFVDGEKIAWALGALVGNAIRHAGDGALRPAAVHVRLSASDADLIFHVDDSGPGIPRDRARWLFTSDPSTGRSTGTALRLVADVVAAHRGEVHAGSTPNHAGARFTIRLPRR